MPQQQVPTPMRQEATPATPYQQQVYPPQPAAPKPSTNPSASQGHKELAREDRGARGRSSSQGSWDGQQRNRSSTRGSWKCRWGTQAVISWMRWPTVWPQGGSETSPTSSAAAGWPRWVPWTEMNGMRRSTSFWP